MQVTICTVVYDGHAASCLSAGRITGVDTVQLSAAAAAGNKTAVGVRYAWADLPDGCNLSSRALLPAVPFTQG